MALDQLQGWGFAHQSQFIMSALCNLGQRCFQATWKKGSSPITGYVIKKSAGHKSLMEYEVHVCGPALRRRQNAPLSVRLKGGGFCLSPRSVWSLWGMLVHWYEGGGPVREGAEVWIQVACVFTLCPCLPLAVAPGCFNPSVTTHLIFSSEWKLRWILTYTHKFCSVVCRFLSRWQTSILFPSKCFQCGMKNVIYGKLVQLKSKVLPRGKFSRWKSVRKCELRQWVDLQIAVKRVLRDVNAAV